MKENNITSEFDVRVDSILNAVAEKENTRKRKKHWRDNMCPFEFACIFSLFGCAIFLIIIGICGMIFDW